MPHVRLKLIMRWCVQNLSTVNDGTNYRPVSMAAGGCHPPPFPPLSFGKLRNFGKTNFYTSFRVSFRLFFFFESDIFYFKLK